MEESARSHSPWREERRRVVKSLSSSRRTRVSAVLQYRYPVQGNKKEKQKKCRFFVGPVYELEWLRGERATAVEEEEMLPGG